MLQRFALQLPTWARQTHPHVRYELQAGQRVSRRGRYIRAILLSLLVILILAGGYVIGSGILQASLGQGEAQCATPVQFTPNFRVLTECLSAITFWPGLGIQILLQIAALGLTMSMVSEQKRRLAWDNLRATEEGTSLALRARWISVYYRLRPFWIILLVLRFVLILGILYDLTSFQGRYIDLLTNPITPEIPPVASAVLVAFMMTAGLILPLTALGLDAAIGLYISVNVQNRFFAILLQLLFILLKLAVLAGLIIGVTQFMTGQLTTLTEPLPWLLMTGYAALGDWGLRYLYLGFFSEVWATVPFTILIGLVLLLWALAQSALSEWILNLAVKRADRIG
jgi:hypothetical protein